jgi:hypothetical protein
MSYLSVVKLLLSGKFSSDRTIADYATEIWGMEPDFTKYPPPYAIYNEKTGEEMMCTDSAVDFSTRALEHWKKL